MISCPLILSAIYMKNHDAIYYFSSGFAFVGLIVMIILACRKDCKTLGKVPMYSEESREEKKPVEMEEKKPEVKLVVKEEVKPAIDEKTFGGVDIKQEFVEMLTKLVL